MWRTRHTNRSQRGGEGSPWVAAQVRPRVRTGPRSSALRAVRTGAREVAAGQAFPAPRSPSRSFIRPEALAAPSGSASVLHAEDTVQLVTQARE